MAEGALNTVVGTTLPAFSSLSQWAWPIGIFIALLAFGGIAWFISSIVRQKAKWNIQIRIRQEDTQNKKVSIDAHIIKAKRVTLDNGLRMIFLQEPLLGKRLFPLLNHYTRPGVYDIILTSDNRIFLIDGIESIDEKRKKLNVGLRYPGIDQQFDEVNYDYAKMNQQDRKNDLLQMIKSASIAVIAIVLLIGFLLAGKYWIEAKELDLQSTQLELSLINTLAENQNTQLEVTNALNVFISRYEAVNGKNSISEDLKILEATT